MNERLGVAGLPRPEGRLIWVHGASVGESLAALPLIEKLLADEPKTHVLVTSGTVTSARMMQARLPPGAIHQFVPLDTPQAVARFLAHWKPDAGLFVESDLWPNLILAAAARGVRLALVNARISAQSAAGWKRVPRTAKTLLGAFDAVLAQDEEIAARFRALGARNVTVAGSLKADAPPLACDDAALAALRAQIGTRPVLLAAQTHSGEDETILPAHDMLRARFADLLTIIVPRHLERAGDIEMLCGDRAAKRRGRGDAISHQTQVYIADTLGELGLFYRLARFCFIGGTLVPMGGHNPLEPAVLNCAVLAGPHRASATTAYQAILGAQGFGGVASSGDIAREAARLFASPAAAEEAGRAAARGAAKLSGAVARTVAMLKNLLRDNANACFLEKKRRDGGAAGAAGRALWRQRGLQGPPRPSPSRQRPRAVCRQSDRGRQRQDAGGGSAGRHAADAGKEYFLPDPWLWRQGARPGAGAGRRMTRRRWATKRCCWPAPRRPSWRATGQRARRWPTREGADVIVMDDGHQNFSLAKNLSLVVVDGESGFGNGRMMPAGPLREPVAQGLARADAVVIMGGGNPDLGGFRGAVLRARLVPQDASLRGERLFAFAGIGRPEKFIASLKQAGAVLTGTQFFPDHHPYRPGEIAALKARGALVTTEKDYVRLSPQDRDGIAVLKVAARYSTTTPRPCLTG